MSQPDRIVLSEATMSDRLAARRERTAAERETLVKQDNLTTHAGDMADRLTARRARQEGKGKQSGEGEGSLGQQVAREPLFVGLGIRGHHHAGVHDHEAPPVQAQDPMSRPSRRPIGAREPEAPRSELSRRHRM